MTQITLNIPESTYLEAEEYAKNHPIRNDGLKNSTRAVLRDWIISGYTYSKALGLLSEEIDLPKNVKLPRRAAKKKTQPTSPEKRKYFIYILSDPRDKLPKYVGFSLKPRNRFRKHIRQSRFQRSRKEKWIHSLLSIGIEPDIQIIAETYEPRELEIYWIAKLRAEGNDLVNGSDGGEGGSL